MEVGDFVEVEWMDAFFTEEDSIPEEWPERMLVVSHGTVARIIRSEEGFPLLLSIAAERFPDYPSHFRGITHIPWGLISKMEVLKHGST